MGVRLFTLVTYKYFMYGNINETLRSERVDANNVTHFFQVYCHTLMSDSLLNCELAWLVCVPRL